jgi:Fur family ferric uptake transcriptional regulator
MRLRLNRNYKRCLQGHLLTGQRRLLLDLIRQADGHIDARELIYRASKEGEFVSPATVYRSLNLFKELGLIDERRLGKVRCYYEVKSSKEHHHLVCRCCGKIIEVESPYVSKLVKQVERDYGFKVNKAELVMEGRCGQCDEENGKE